MGKRLGIGTTKCLVDVDGTSIILRTLRMLDDVNDVRVVVGYQADKVIEAVRAYRNDVTFVFNHDFMHNGTGASVCLAAKHANDYVLTLDGDLLIHPSDMRIILEQEGEFIGVTAPGTDNPVLTSVDDGCVTEFSREHGEFEWTGVCQFRADRLARGDGHVYQLLEPYLPVPYLYIRTKEIDTMNDYEAAVKWVRNGFSDNVVVGVIGDARTTESIDVLRRIAESLEKALPNSAPRLLFDNVRMQHTDTGASQFFGELYSAVERMGSAGATSILLANDALGTKAMELDAIGTASMSGLVNGAKLCADEIRRRGSATAQVISARAESGVDECVRYLASQGIETRVLDLSQTPTDQLAEEIVKSASAADDLTILDSASSMVLRRSQGTIDPKTIIDPIELYIDSIVQACRRSESRVS